MYYILNTSNIEFQIRPILIFYKKKTLKSINVYTLKDICQSNSGNMLVKKLTQFLELFFLNTRDVFLIYIYFITPWWTKKFHYIKFNISFDFKKGFKESSKKLNELLKTIYIYLYKSSNLFNIALTIFITIA